MDIPQDIINLITDEFRDDLKTLRECALTSLSFLASCRRHIFASTTLASPRSCDQLCSVFSSSPETIRLVRRLSIVDHGWVYSSPTFPLVARHIGTCGSLEALSLRTTMHRFMFPHSTSIKVLLQSTPLRNISIDGIALCSFPVELLKVMTSPSLRHVTFTAECSFSRCSLNSICLNESPSWGSTAPPHLLELQSSQRELLVEYLHGNLEKLRTLRMTARNDVLREIMHLMEASYNKITSLRWKDEIVPNASSKEYGHQGTTNAIPVSLPRNLRLLVFEFHSIATLFAQLMKPLCEGGLPCHTELLVIVTTLNLMTLGSESVEKIDAVFAATTRDRKRYPYFRGVYWAQLTHPSKPHDVVGMALPMLRATGQLKVISGSRFDIDVALLELESAFQGRD
ncbi:hypothetical protein H0H81_004235 [Sphagnurus paluster]|uniref:Uncharacterized protein n=1 Tax=Sphagnurus paluster TaxID=117069 RepID=A0A9P7FSX5_9AGAR|nr:hypothetical protein H0H81_004235 [Sphagnurus paluster]